MDTCNTNWSERAGSPKEPLPSTRLLLLLKILVKTPFLSSNPLNFLQAVWWPPLLMLLTMFLLMSFVLEMVSYISQGSDCQHCEEGSAFFISFYPEQQGPESYSGTTKLQTQCQNHNWKAEPTCKANLVTHNNQPRSVLSALTSLTCMSAAHSNPVARTP